MSRRTVSPLTAPMGQTVATVIALDHGRMIDIRQAQEALTFHTSWPFGTELTTREQLRAWFARPVPA